MKFFTAYLCRNTNCFFYYRGKKLFFCPACSKGKPTVEWDDHVVALRRFNEHDLFAGVRFLVAKGHVPLLTDELLSSITLGDSE